VPGGGRSIRVESVAAGDRVTVAWRETVERAVRPTGTRDAGVDTDTPRPESKLWNGRASSLRWGCLLRCTFMPMFREPGPATTETSALWLSREAYSELGLIRKTAWRPDVLTRITGSAPTSKTGFTAS